MISVIKRIFVGFSNLCNDAGFFICMCLCNIFEVKYAKKNKWCNNHYAGI